MTTVAREARPWTPGRLSTLVVVVLALQLLVIFGLSERPVATLARRDAPRPVGMVPETQSRPRTMTWAASDPTVFALVHPNGFSGPVWLQTPTPGHQIGIWRDNPHYIRPDLTAMGTSILELARINEAEKTGFALPPGLLRPPSVPPAIRPVSSVRTEGDLPRLLSATELPPEVHTEVLTNTVVRVIVRTTGEVFSTIVLVGSGSQQADAGALEYAQSARFEARRRTPLDAGGPEFAVGKLIFDWATAAPVAPAAPATPPAK